MYFTVLLFYLFFTKACIIKFAICWIINEQDCCYRNIGLVSVGPLCTFFGIERGITIVCKNFLSITVPAVI